MPNFQKPVYSEAPHTGGWIWMPASEMEFTLSGANPLLFTRNAAGDYSWNRVAAGAETYNLVVGITALRRLLETVDFQEFAGNAALQPSAAGPKGVPGAPPFTGVTQITPQATAQAKDFRITDVAIVYQVGVANLTSAALLLNKTKFVEAVAPLITNIPLAAVALPLVARATPYTAVRAVLAPVVVTDDISDINAELQVVLQNTGTFRMYGIGFHGQFNYN